MTTMEKAKCHFPENLSRYVNEACFVGDLGMYKMVDISKRTNEDGFTSINYKFENPRNDPKKILDATEPSIPLLPPNDAYRPGYTLTLLDVFKGSAHLRTMEQFENLCSSYPSLVFGPLADHSLFDTWESFKKQSVEVFKKYHDALFLGCSRDLIMNELHKEMDFKGIESYANHLHHGSCISFMPAAKDRDNVAGVLLYPSGAAMDILTVTTLAPVVDGNEIRLSPKSENDTHRIKLGGVIRQIESMTYPGCNKGYSVVRTDYQCHLVKINLSEDGDVTIVTVVETLNAQHSPTSVAVSPFIQTEYIISLDSSEVIIADSSSRLLRSSEFPSDDRKRNPIFSHFGAHPREAFIHDQKMALLYDFRSPNHTKNIIFQLPAFCLPQSQYFCVAKQHPRDHFYHYIATQDALLLLDQRFPQHAVFHTCHHGSGMPSFLEVSSCNEAENMDVVMVGEHSEKQVHCVFVENETESVPRLFSLPWKINRFDEWLEVIDGVKSSDNPRLWERLYEPLLGISACPVSVENINSWNVIQVSGAGDVFCQSFSSPGNDCQSPKHLSVKESSRKLCDLWMKSCSEGKTVEVQPEDRCRKRSVTEYHPPCDQCQRQECLLGAKSDHGAKRYIMRIKKTVDEDLLESRKQELLKLWDPLMCGNCAMLNAHSISVTGGNNSKWKSFVKSLKLPWEDDVESSNTFKNLKRKKTNNSNKKTLGNATSGSGETLISFESPAANGKRNHSEADSNSPILIKQEFEEDTNEIQIETEFGSSSLIVADPDAEIPLSQTSSYQSQSLLQEEVAGDSDESFSKLLESKKKKVATRRKRSSLPQGIGF